MRISHACREISILFLIRHKNGSKYCWTFKSEKRNAHQHESIDKNRSAFFSVLRSVYNANEHRAKKLSSIHVSSKHSEQVSHCKQDYTMSSVSFHTAREEPALTFIESASGIADEDTLQVHLIQLDGLCNSVKYRRMSDAKIDDLIERIRESLLACKIGAGDVANLRDFDEEDEVDRHPPFTETLKSPVPGLSKINTWKTKVSVENWPRVAWEFTRLTEEEKEKINQMEIIELYEFVKKERPERVKKIFPNGYDGMTKARMQKRVINLLRLHYDELVAMTQTTKRDKRKEITRYLVDVKSLTADKFKFFIDG